MFLPHTYENPNAENEWYAKGKEEQSKLRVEHGNFWIKIRAQCKKTGHYRPETTDPRFKALESWT